MDKKASSLDAARFLIGERTSQLYAPMSAATITTTPMTAATLPVLLVLALRASKASS